MVEVSQFLLAFLVTMESMKPLKVKYSPENFAKERNKKGLSQTELADKMGVDKNTVFNCEQEGANPGIFTLLKAGLALNVIFEADPVVYKPPESKKTKKVKVPPKIRASKDETPPAAQAGS